MKSDGVLLRSIPHPKWKLTPWFPWRVKPVRDGVYQRKLDDGKIVFSHWGGGEWCLICDTPKDAAEWAGYRSSSQTCEWRGLTL